MNDYCIDLKFDFTALNDIFLPRNRHYEFNTTILNKNLIIALARKQVYISFIEIFYSPPFFNSKIHVDVDPGDYVKLNIIKGGKNSVMSWYRSKVDKEKNLSANNIGATSIDYDLLEVDHLYSSSVDISLVQVGVPHSVKKL